MSDESLNQKDGKKMLSLVLDQLKEPDHFLSEIQNLYKTTKEERNLLNLKDGRIFEQYSRPMIIGEKLTGRFWGFRDITKKKQSEVELRESEEKYRQLVEDMNEVLLISDQMGRITYVSPSIEPVTGYSQSEGIGRSFMEFVHPDDLERMAKGFQDVLSGDSGTSEYRLISKSGEVRWIRTSGQRILKGDRVIGMRGMLVDITESKRMEAQIQQTQKMEAIGTLAGGIAHDFNNILGTVILLSEISLLDIPEGSSLHKHIAQILNAGMRAKNLVHQILAFSRQKDQEYIPISIYPVANEGLKLLRSTLPTTIEIHRYLEKDTELI